MLAAVVVLPVPDWGAHLANDSTANDAAVVMGAPGAPIDSCDAAGPTVAVVATVAVANLPDHKAAPAETIDTVPISAAPDSERWCWPHSNAMNGAEIETFTGRVALFTAKGLTSTEADALADKLLIRDREGDDRRVCLECSHLSGWAGRRQCRGLQHAGMGGPLVSAGQVAMLQRCDGFKATGGKTS